MVNVTCSNMSCDWKGRNVPDHADLPISCPKCGSDTLINSVQHSEANHQDITAWGSVTYWKNGVAVTGDEPWNNATIFVNPNNGVAAFRTNNYTELSNYKYALDRAFEAGRAAKSAEIRNVLEITK